MHTIEDDSDCETHTFVPIGAFEDFTLRRLVEEFVTRDGTDYGLEETPLHSRVDTVVGDLKAGKAWVVFDPQTQKPNILSKEDLRIAGISPPSIARQHTQASSRLSNSDRKISAHASSDILVVTARNLPRPPCDFPILEAACKKRGLLATSAFWDDTDVDWDRAPTILLQTPWDYSERRKEFMAWLTARKHHPGLHNPAHIVCANMDKRYLLKMQDDNLPVIPTWHLSADSLDILHDLPNIDASAWVAKPVVGAGGTYALRWDKNEPYPQELKQLLNAMPEGFLLQPFLPSILDQGEYSLIFIDGVFSHAVQKMPAQGDFRVQAQHGGTTQSQDAPKSFVHAAQEIVASTAAKETLYARVDLGVGADGSPLLMELELFEPELFLSHHPPAAESLLDGLIARCPKLAHAS